MNKKSIFVKYLVRFGIYLLITSIIIASSTAIRYSGIPSIKYSISSWDHIDPSVPNTNLTFNILFDQHSHTYYSDGILSVEENIKWHIAMGFNACAITDHNNLRNSDDVANIAQKYKDDILVIQGLEWTTNRIHMNFLGISEWNIDIPSLPTDQEILDAIDEVHDQGGVVVANHLPWSNRTGAINLPTHEQLLSWGVDYIEIVNEYEFDYSSYEFCLDNNESIGVITGTDMHRPMNVWSWTAMNVTEFTAEALMEQLRSRNTSIIYYPEGVEEQGIYNNNGWFTLLQPLYNFGGLIASYYLGYGKFDTFGILTFLAYYILTYFLIEGTVILIKKIEKKVSK